MKSAISSRTAPSTPLKLKLHPNNMETTYESQIEDHIKNNKVFIFMKGEPDGPMCRYSSQAVSCLIKAGANFNHFNVLADYGMREAIKEYSKWPTLPQIYVDGKFVGGADIIQELSEKGELKGIVN